MSQAVRLELSVDQAALDAAYRGLAERGPVVCVDLPDGLRTWVITRYAEGREALKDPRFIKDPRGLVDADHGFAGNRYVEDLMAVEGRHMLNTDGDAHTRLRGVLSGRLSAPAVARRQPDIERIAEDLVARFADDPGPVDLMSAYARPLPELVTGQVIGLSETVSLEAAALSRLLGERHDPRSPEMRRTYTDLVDLLREHTRQPPADDRSDTVLAALHGALARGRINRREMLSTVMVLLAGGISSTAIAIGHGAAVTAQAANTLWNLLGDGDQSSALVNELLRHHPPFSFSPWRFAREAVEVAGVTIPAGAVVFVLLATANRDPAVLAAPEQVRPEREEHFANLTFGHGPHYCVGSHLARAEILVALRTLHARCPNLRLVESHDRTVWTGLLFDRTPTTLPVLPLGGAR